MTQAKIEKQIFEALGLNYNQNEDDGNEKTDEQKFIKMNNYAKIYTNKN